MPDLISQIMEFRTTYLQALAQATVDLRFRERLTTEPLMTLKEDLNYHCPWNLNLELHDDAEIAPRVNLANGVVMTRPFRGEVITIYLPERPDTKDPAVVMNALAAYYAQNPWFLYSEDKPPLLKKLEKLAPRAIADVLPETPLGKRRITEWRSTPNMRHDAPWSSVNASDNPSNRFDLGDCLSDFISFSAALFNALALSWEDREFASLLMDNEDHQPKQTVMLLSQWLQYDYPWEIDLVVERDKTAKYNIKERKWESSTAPKLMLTIPWMSGAQKPAEEIEANRANTKVAVMGLVLYNTDGPGYPFTCG